MGNPSHGLYQKNLREWFKNHADEPDVAEALGRYADAAVVLWHLDLEPARPLLLSCYSPVPRGSKPRDPIIVLRCLLLSILVGQPSINKWARDLKGSRVLRALAGISDEEDPPGVGTFYDFLHRLHDGPPGFIRAADRPSVIECKRAALPRDRRRKTETKVPKTRRKRGMPRKDDAARVEAVATGQVARLVGELQAARDNPAPMDLVQRLAEILLLVAVDESARRGLLGKLSHLSVNGDGSCLPTGASCHGRRVCGHPRTERCDCPCVYSDPDAQWGWDQHNKKWVFGYHFYEIGVTANKHDLPLFVTIDPANSSDFVASLRNADRCLKLLRQQHPDWHISRFVADAGHDAEGIHRFFLDQGITPVIPARSTLPTEYPGRPDIRLSSRGVPLCQANVEMALRSREANGKLVFFCPARAGLIKACPLAPKADPGWRCRPESSWAPTVTLNALAHPRICGPLPRNSSVWRREYNARSGCERRNSVKKGPFKLVEARHRRSSFWLIRLNLTAILQHANVWTAKLDRKAFTDFLLGRREVMPAAA